MLHISRQIWETPAIVSLINASVELVLICQLYTTPTHRIIHQALCTICRWHSGKWPCGGCLHLADGLGLFLSAVDEVFDPSQPNPMLYDALVLRCVETRRNASDVWVKRKKIVLSWTARGSSLTIFIHKNQRNLVGPFVRKRS